MTKIISKFSLLIFFIFSQNCFAPRKGHPFSDEKSKDLELDPSNLKNTEEMLRFNFYTKNYCLKCNSSKCKNPTLHKNGLCPKCNNPANPF